MPDELPLFPTSAPPLFRDGAVTKRLLNDVLENLSAVVDVAPDLHSLSTPCRSFSVGALQQHVLAWVQFFAAALNDPLGHATRIDPTTWALSADESPAEIVKSASALLGRSIDANVADQLVVMSAARMAGDGVLAMMLGEYLVHGWDLAMATGRPWGADELASESALTFLQSMIAPEFRGEDSGFFGDEIPAPPGASAFVRLLCFAGRDPNWTAPLKQ